jgi:hypothetical protein
VAVLLLAGLGGGLLMRRSGRSQAS